MKQMQSAGLVLYQIKQKEPYYLLLHYPHGHWGLPKGKVEGSETVKEAAIRELQEETGLDAQLIEGFEKSLDYVFQHNSQPVKKTVIFFVAKTHESEIILSHEHVGYAWLPFDDAIERLTYDNTRRILADAHAFLTATVFET